MKKHKHAIENLRQTLVGLTEKKRQLKAQIQALRSTGPETGPERSELWQNYVKWTRPSARVTHLALGLLRGTPYAAMEGGHDPANSAPFYVVWKAIQEACGEDTELAAEWTLDRVRGLILDAPSPAQVAA